MNMWIHGEIDVTAVVDAHETQRAEEYVNMELIKTTDTMSEPSPLTHGK